MPKPMLTREPTKSVELEKVQDHMAAFAKVVGDNPLLDGKRITGQELAAGAATEFTHALGRQPRGFIVLDVDAAGDIYRTAWDSTTLSLYNTGGATVTVDLWVF